MSRTIRGHSLVKHREEFDEQMDMPVQVFSKPNYRDFRVATETAWDDMIDWERNMWTERAKFYYDAEYKVYNGSGGHKPHR